LGSFRHTSGEQRGASAPRFFSEDRRAAWRSEAPVRNRALHDQL